MFREGGGRDVESDRQYLPAISVFDDHEAIVDACCRAWNRFADNPDVVSSITSRQWAKVSAQGRWYELRGPECLPL